jgi:16S rRNA (uracil1498-N3)-methyltransferase
MRVLRKRIGDTIQVVDGKGRYYEAIINTYDGKNLTAKIQHIVTHWNIKPYRIAMGVALTKNPDRFEWFCEKATEIGINEIIPLITERTESRKLNIARIEKILLSAIKQSGKALLPELKGEMILGDLLNSISAYHHYQKFIAWCETKKTQHLKRLYQKGNDALILIGPEGDFTQEEINAATQHKFTSVSLGRERLRSETAAILACHIVNLLNDE